ncbi:MAG: 2-dehydropantoate 2-reductase [Actinobacteria bacterium]|nr:2-dehydropantoate 2-reductase [Actinomycetota bacterium]
MLLSLFRMRPEPLADYGRTGSSEIRRRETNQSLSGLEPGGDTHGPRTRSAPTWSPRPLDRWLEISKGEQLTSDPHDTQDRPSVAVVGTGAIGAYIASRLLQAGIVATLCARSPRERIVVQHPDGETTLGPVLTDPAAITEPVRWAIVTTKATDKAGIGPWLDALAGPETTVVVAQNGVEQDEAVPSLPSLPSRATVLPALVYVSAERLDDETVRHHGFDKLVVPDGELGVAFSALFEGTPVSVERVSDFRTAAWRKLLANVANSPLTTVLDCRLGVIQQSPELEALASDLMAEAVAVARAEGAELGEDDVAATIAAVKTFPADGSSSMRSDRNAGRPLEHEALTGVVVRRGLARGIPVPLNQAMLRLLRAIDQQRLDNVRG